MNLSTCMHQSCQKRSASCHLIVPFSRTHDLETETDVETHLVYIHNIQVNHGCDTHEADLAFLSFHRYVKAGIHSMDWCVVEEMQNQCLWGYETRWCSHKSLRRILSYEVLFLTTPNFLG